MEEMPERSVLEALANTAHWVDWTRHFGLPSRMTSGIANLRERYLITTFAYGCGLGATQAARHFGGAVLPEELSFVDRRHIDIANLRAGSADLQNLFLGFDLTKLWGRGESAAADGTHFETFRNNLMAARLFAMAGRAESPIGTSPTITLPCSAASLGAEYTRRPTFSTFFKIRSVKFTPPDSMPIRMASRPTSSPWRICLA